jgi:hypothetical protein
MSKLGQGHADYIISWLDNGILLQNRFEAAMLLVYLSFDANLGAIDHHLEILRKILQPFTTSNFINSSV